MSSKSFLTTYVKFANDFNEDYRIIEDKIFGLQDWFIRLGYRTVIICDALYVYIDP